ncbi:MULTISPECIES: phage holin family protein [Paenibacillus]|uniref:phage holin family protein n=1 Tax=Paenibacillus TaxID=44249 RepID=UPI00203B3D59|nr:phage holin family protein [Paenibacillus camelliae]MCM3632333.1 phage holin family protein [Paenibacillus camelliae]
MDAIMQDELYLFVKQYVEPELLILIPVLLFFGWMMKRTPNIPNWVIPYVNTAIAIAGGVVLAATIVDGIIQGILVSAMTTLSHNLYSQWRKKNIE